MKNGFSNVAIDREVPAKICSTLFQVALALLMVLTHPGVSFQSAVKLVEVVWGSVSDPVTALHLKTEGRIAVAWDQPWNPKHAIHFHVVCLNSFDVFVYREYEAFFFFVFALAIVVKRFATLRPLLLGGTFGFNVKQQQRQQLIAIIKV